jgi:hypothetical protein
MLSLILWWHYFIFKRMCTISCQRKCTQDKNVCEFAELLHRLTQLSILKQRIILNLFNDYLNLKSDHLSVMFKSIGRLKRLSMTATQIPLMFYHPNFLSLQNNIFDQTVLKYFNLVNLLLYFYSSIYQLQRLCDFEWNTVQKAIFLNCEEWGS